MMSHNGGAFRYAGWGGDFSFSFHRTSLLALLFSVLAFCSFLLSKFSPHNQSPKDSCQWGSKCPDESSGDLCQRPPYGNPTTRRRSNYLLQRVLAGLFFSSHVRSIYVTVTQVMDRCVCDL